MNVLLKYIEKEIGCKLTWLKNDSAESGSNLDQCNTAQYEEYQRLYYEIVASSENTISTRTGCMPRGVIQSCMGSPPGSLLSTKW